MFEPPLWLFLLLEFFLLNGILLLIAASVVCWAQWSTSKARRRFREEHGRDFDV